MGIKKWFQIFRDGLGSGRVMPHQFAFLVDNPIRGLILSPKKLAGRLGLKDNMQVLDFGSGPGYYSSEIAHRIPNGHLELLDIQPEMLEKAKKKLQSFKNTKFTLSDGDPLPFEASKFDVVFLVTVFGELSKPEKTLDEIHRVLKPDALLSISEHRTDPDFTYFKELKTKVEPHGFAFIKKHGWMWNYTANFRKI